MTRGGAPLAHCALRAACAARAHRAARAPLPVRVHRAARLVRPASVAAAVSFGFSDDEAAPSNANFGGLPLAADTEANVDRAQLPAPSTSDSCSRLVAELCKGGRHRDAERAFRAAIANGLSPSDAASKALVRALLDAHEPERAVAVFRARHQSAQPTLSAYTDLIAGLVRALRADGRSAAPPRVAVDLWEELRSSGLQLDAAAFSAAAGAYAANGQLVRARGLVGDMQSRGLSPSARLYNVFLTAAGRERDLQMLEATVSDMRAASVKPNEATHGALVHGLVRCGELERAAAALRAARDARPAAGVQAYTALVQGFVRAGLLDRGLAVMADMRAAGVPPNVVTFTTLADGLVRLERLAEARALLSQMAAERVPANAVTYNTLLRGYALRGEVQAGLELLSVMGAARVRTSEVTYNTLISACVRDKDMDVAHQVLVQMREAGHAPDAVTFTTLLKGCRQLRRVDEARVFFAEMLASPTLRPDTAAFNAMLSLLAAAGETGEDEALLSRMLADGVAVDVASYGGVVAGRARRGDLDGAFSTYDAACRAGIQPDGRMFDSLLDACVRCGRFDRATSVLADMDARGVAPDRLKYRRLLQELYRPNPHRRAPQGQGLGRRRGSVDASRQLAIELERFKFWLGMSNNLLDLYDLDDAG